MEAVLSSEVTEIRVGPAYALPEALCLREEIYAIYCDFRGL